MPAPADKPSSGIKVLATNRRAHHDYLILETFEAGIELHGAEVKSIREGRVSLNESFADLDKGQVYLHSLHVQPYEHSRSEGYDPVRPRRLLLHHEEIKRLIGKVSVKGHTLIPLRLYLRRGFVKVEIALAQGKQEGDKRETLREKTAARETARAIAARVRR